MVAGQPGFRPIQHKLDAGQVAFLPTAARARGSQQKNAGATEMKWTAEQCLTNWRNAFDTGHYRAARAWWSLYAALTFGQEG